jgi:iron(III) transport system ATP-binding protein
METKMGSASSSSKLELRNLSKVFGQGKEQVMAVDSIDLDINPGEFITFLGPSGCGKTTTLRMIAGFETPSQGSILLDGQDVSSLSPDKRPMGMVFQSYALFPHMSVYQNVSYGPRIKKLPAEQVKMDVSAVLDSMSLSSMANRSPNQLSGGQQQRVALARAMVMQPKVLLFDEPLSNLDAKLRAQMRIEIREVQQRLGITSIFVTHDQDEAMSISDRIVVMRNAKIEQVGIPADVYLRPASVFVADFIGISNFLTVDGVSSAGAGKAKVNVLGRAIEVPAHKEALNKESILLVRPESIRVKPAQAGNASVSGTQGQVKQVVFYGQHVEYRIQSQVGIITAVVSDPIFSEIVPVGEYAEFAFDPERSWLLPADSK